MAALGNDGAPLDLREGQGLFVALHAASAESSSGPGYASSSDALHESLIWRESQKAANAEGGAGVAAGLGRL